MLGIGAGGTYFLTKNKNVEAAGDKKDAPEKSKTVKSQMNIESFVVNLADTEDRAFLRVGISLGLGIEPIKGEKEKGSSPLPVIKDTLLTVLTSRTSNDLLTAEGKAKLKSDLIKALNEKAPELDVKDLYFTEFLVQR